MIQSNIKANYGDPSQLQEGFIRIECDSATTTRSGGSFNFEHYAIVDDQTGAKTFVKSETKYLTTEQFNDYSGLVSNLMLDENTLELTDWEIRQLRLKHFTMLWFKNDLLPSGKTAWGFLPNDWEFVN